MTTNKKQVQKEHSPFWDILHKIYIVIAVIVSPLLAITKTFFHFPTLEYFGISLLAFILLVVGCIFFFISRKAKTETDLPFYLKKGFLLGYGVLLLFSFGNLLYLIGGKYSSNNDCTQLKTRIVIMLPLGDIIKPAYQDGMRQMYGYAEFLKDNNSHYTEDFEFVPVDHSMNYETAKQIIEREVNNGTKYFICTMSKVNEDLSKNFEKILASCHFTGDKPILVCTVTSSPNLTLKPNLVYRYFIRSQEEGKCLADVAKKQNLNSATYIVVNDPYGKGAVKEFKSNWDRKFTEGVMVDFGSSVDDIRKDIEKQLKNIPENERQAIFIAHYGNGIDNIIKAISMENIRGIIFATSTLSINDWQDPIKSNLANYNWWTCVPDYKPLDKNQNDIIKNFTTQTLKRLVQTINLTKGNPNSTFDENWKKAEVYANLEISWDTNGDAIVPMKAVGGNYFK